MTAIILPILCAVFVWWFGTGAVLLADGLPAAARRWAMAACCGMAGGALIALQMVAGDASIAGAYIGFVAAIALWGWNELLFLSGLVTGPVRRSCPDGATPARRFWLAAGTMIYHELALVATGVAIALVSWGQENIVGLCTFALLFVMRLSAKLNIFFGVPNMSDEMLPHAVEHLKSYFGPRRTNPFFPLSVTAGTLAAAWLVLVATAPETSPGHSAGASLMAALVMLGTLEHWLLILPLKDAALWRWAHKPTPTEAPGLDPALDTAGRGASSPGNGRLS